MLRAHRPAPAGGVAGIAGISGIVGVNVVLALLLTGCAATEDAASSPASSEPAVTDVQASDEAALDECSTPNLTVVNPGQMTIGAREVDLAPLFVDGDPSTGQGFESALGYAVAETLGFPAADVAWVILEPGDDPFGVGPRVDFVIGQVPATAPTDSTTTSDPYLASSSGSAPYALLLAAGNPLVTCVNGALAELDALGEMSALAEEWLSGSPWEGSVVGAAARVS